MISKIGEYFNCTRSTISYWLRKYKIKLRTPSESMELFGNKPEIKISKKELHTLFMVRKLKLDEVAKKYNCKITTIIRRLRKYKITNKFSNGKIVKISKKELEELYIRKNLNTYEIADMYGCCQTTIWKRLKEYNIKRRDYHELYPNMPSKSILKELYVKKRLSTWEIEKRYGYSRGTVHKKLRKYGFIRTRAEAHRIYPRKDFDGDLIEKAYLIGFKLGDLRARKIWENSETINVDCGSNKLEQIELIKNLFRKYGKVWIKRNKNRKGYLQIEAHLNDSFSFLLEQKAPKWVFKNKSLFFSFLAGFTDAEGCISINRREQAFYSLGNYNKSLLNIIREHLILYGIPCRKLSISYRKGKVVFERYKCNSDYYTLAISKKESLLKLIKFIKPYTRHRQKIRGLGSAEKNIFERNKKYHKNV